MSRLTKFILATVLVVAAPVQLLADVTGKILGTVTDSSGAVIIGATVTLHNNLTGYDRTVKSDSAGYEFLAVPIGERYAVSVESAGFSKAVQSGITLLVNQDFRADIKLAVGTTAQTVTATADVIQVETNHQHPARRRHPGHQDPGDAAQWAQLCRSDRPSGGRCPQYVSGRLLLAQLSASLG